VSTAQLSVAATLHYRSIHRTARKTLISFVGTWSINRRRFSPRTKLGTYWFTPIARIFKRITVAASTKPGHKSARTTQPTTVNTTNTLHTNVSLNTLINWCSTERRSTASPKRDPFAHPNRLPCPLSTKRSSLSLRKQLKDGHYPTKRPKWIPRLPS